MKTFRNYNQTIKFLQCNQDVGDKIFSNLRNIDAKLYLMITFLPENILTEANYFCTSLDFKQLELTDKIHRSDVNRELAKTSIAFFSSNNKYVVNPYYMNVLGPHQFELLEDELKDSMYKDLHPLVGMMALTISKVSGYRDEARGIYRADEYLSILGVTR